VICEFLCSVLVLIITLSLCVKKTVLQGNELLFDRVTEADTGIYTCYLDNFVQPVVSYKFSLMVEGKIINY